MGNGRSVRLFHLINPAAAHPGYMTVGAGTSFLGAGYSKSRGDYGYGVGHTVAPGGTPWVGCNAACYHRINPQGGIRDFIAGIATATVQTIDAVSQPSQISHLAGQRSGGDYLSGWINHGLDANPQNRMYRYGNKTFRMSVRSARGATLNCDESISAVARGTPRS